MPKRPIYLQPPDNPYRRTRRDLEFLCNYWDRLLAMNQNYDIRLPELLRANHLMRHLTSLPLNHGLRVNVNFTILDDNDRLEPQDIYTEMYQLNNVPFCIESHNGFYRPPCNVNTERYNNLLRNYIRQMNENYAAMERELARGRISRPFVECDRFTGCQNAFYNQRATTYNWNKFPAGSQTCSARISPRLREKHINKQENNNRPACALFQHDCGIADKNAGCSVNQQATKQKENSPKIFNDLPKTAEQFSFQNPTLIPSCATVKNLEANNNALHNCVGTALDRNNNAMIKPHSSKQFMEECQSVDKIINDATKAFHLAESNVKVNDDGIGVNKNYKQTIDPQSSNCQENALPESSIAMDRSRQERGSKRKLDDLEDRSATTKLDLGISSQQNQWGITEGINSRIKNAPILEKSTRNRVRNGRITTEGRPYARRHASSPKYASFLRMFRKEEVNERGNSSSRRDDGEKLQRRRGFSAENTEYDANPRMEKRTPTPRSTVHTTYNPIMRSSATDPILDSSGLTIQLLRLAVLLYAPALMPALNSLIAQQNQQTPLSSSSFERSNDLLTHIFQLLNEQQSISNLPFVSLESERVSSTLTTETNTESLPTHSKQKEEDISITTKEPAFSLKQESISAGTSRWNSSKPVQQQKENDKKLQLTSMLTDSDVRLDRSIFAMEDFRKFEEFLKTGKKRSEDVRSLSTRSKNEIIMKEYFRTWLHRLLQQLNSANSNLSANDQKTKYSEGSSGNTGESSLENVEGQRNTDCLIVEESPDSLKDDENIFTEYEDSDDQKSFTSTTSTSSSRSLKQSDARKEKSRKNKSSQD